MAHPPLDVSDRPEDRLVETLPGPDAQPAAGAGAPRGRSGLLARRIGTRLLGAVVVVLGVVTITFVLTRVVAADPTSLLVPPGADAATRAHVRHELGLDQSLLRQYLIFLRNVLHGDLGVSFATGQPVTSDLSRRLGATLDLAVPAIVLGLIAGVGLGVVSGIRRNRFADHAIRLVTVLALAIPQFWLGLMLLSLFYARLHVLPGPIGRLDSGVAPPPHLTGMYLIDAPLTGHWSLLWMAIQHLVLPVFVLACGVFAPITRITRSAMIESLDTDYVLAARAAGFSARRIHWRYALKNALLPVITMGANGIAFALTGTVLVENVFGWPGVGQYALNAVQQSDFPALQGFVLYAALVYVVLYLLVDLVYALVDPRLRG